MQVQDFCDWAHFSSVYKINHTVPRPHLSDMVYVEARRGQKKVCSTELISMVQTVS